MIGRVSSSRLRTVASVTTVGMVTALAGVLAAGPATADTASPLDVVSKELTYTCTFPLVGPQPVTATVSVDLPTSAAVGERIQPTGLAIDFTLSENIVTAFRLIGAATMEADGVADVDVAFGGRTLTMGVPNLKAPKQDIPASGPMSSSMTGPMPSFILYEPGSLEIGAGQQFFASATALDENGNDTALGNPIDIPCTQDAGQDAHLGTIEVTGAPTAGPAAGMSTQGSVDKELAYTCTFPEAGQQDAVGRVTATFPDQAQVDQRAEITDAEVQADINAASVDVLRDNGAATVEGSGQADLHAGLSDASGTLELTLGLPATIPPVDVPAAGGLTASMPINTPSLIFRAPGDLSVSAGDLSGTLTPRDAAGDETALGTFDVPCQPQSGQDTHLATVPIVA
ncbi:hypothetical protein FB471_4011 [Amycolatopsis cihanbeyliensis]|uniref:DUF6801 domain-containing protein n=1 Tax=Amycolatopsis cihanbeyliensis TaxID=1128664 RepID=A0A542DMD1_AMYCI|nr:hypothetical protein FB471_4011 [Amycolatopsis cihanbeyliensis]